MGLTLLNVTALVPRMLAQHDVVVLAQYTTHSTPCTSVYDALTNRTSNELVTYRGERTRALLWERAWPRLSRKSYVAEVG
jgi:hypothetical protein